MAPEGDDIQRLTDRIDTLVQVNERLIRALSQSLPSTAEDVPAEKPINRVFTSTSSPVLSPTIPLSGRPRRNTSASVLDIDSIRKPSLFTGEESSESEDDESFFVQDTLPAESFADGELKLHLKRYNFDGYGRAILQEILDDPRALDNASIVPVETDSLREHVTYHHANTYEVGTDGSALPYNTEAKDLSQAIWESLSNTNADGRRQRRAVGKITIVREPSALLFAAVHLTMNNHLDMDQIFRLLTDDTRTKAYMKGCLKNDDRQQRSFVFSFKYHCIVGDSRKPEAWQESDENLSSSRDHIPISTCSSVVALSLSGKPTNTLKRRSRRAKTIVGQIFDPFAPWKVLCIQCFPDWESTVDVHEQNRHYVNGTEAFLVTVLAEYKDAQKRLRKIIERIVAHVTPPSTLMFDGAMRDKLLFEDKRYTYSRRYFWAFQTLATMNDSIEAMIQTYKETFTDEVWAGEHKYIWPGTKDQSSRYSNWRKKMAHLRKQFEDTINELEEVLALNRKEQKDIKSLRDQLFSGTSVKESREALRQNDNIKLLTLVTIFFLPLTFVTSIFGMTNMPQGDNFVHFAIATVTICIPSYLIIFSLNSDVWQDRYKAMFRVFCEFMAHPFRPHRSESEKPRNWWTRFWEPKEETKQQKPRQIRSVADYEGLAAGTEKLGVPNNHNEAERPSLPRPTANGSRSSVARFNLSTFERKPRLEKHDTNLPHRCSLSTLAEEDLSPVPLPRKSLFRSITDRINGQNPARSPV